MISSLITRKVLKKKIFYYSVLESSRDKLQKYAIKNWGFRLKNSKYFLCDLDGAIQSQTDMIIK